MEGEHLAKPVKHCLIAERFERWSIATMGKLLSFLKACISTYFLKGVFPVLVPDGA
jgi:hypothetical protein